MWSVSNPPGDFHSLYTNLCATPVDNGCIIIRESTTTGNPEVSQRYTRREVGRMLGVAPSRLRYWERLQLVRPLARWGERFYTFRDLVALRTLQRLTERRVPALRVRRAVKLIEEQFGSSKQPLQEFQFLDQGGDVLVIPPGAARPFSPIKRQWAFLFDSVSPAKLHSMASPSPEQLFQAALDCETQSELLPQAIENYRHVLELAPGWVDAHINLGVALYQMGNSDEALAEFACAVRLDPLNGISRYNLGCVLEERGDMDQAIEHLCPRSPFYAGPRRRSFQSRTCL